MNVDKKNVRFPKTLLEPLRHTIESRDLGVNFDEMLQHLGIERAEFDNPSFSIDGEAFVRLHRWLKQRTQGRIHLKDWLSGYSATSIGLAGLAALSSLSARDALSVAIRYMPLFAPAIKVELLEGAQISQLVMELVTDLE